MGDHITEMAKVAYKFLLKCAFPHMQMCVNIRATLRYGLVRMAFIPKNVKSSHFVAKDFRLTNLSSILLKMLESRTDLYIRSRIPEVNCQGLSMLIAKAGQSTLICAMWCHGCREPLCIINLG